MDSLLALTVLFVIFAFGDFVSAKTKSIFSMMFVASVVLLVGFWVGLPTTIFEDAAVLKFGGIMIAFLITHMGTLMSFNDLKQQWKTVVIALGAIVGIAVILFVVGPALIGREYAIASAPPIAGGVVAAIIVGDAATAKGLELIPVFATLLVVVQGFFGFPVASILLNKEAKRIRQAFRDNEANKTSAAVREAAITSENKVAKRKLIPELPKDLQTSFVLLAKLGIVALIGFKLSALTNDVVNKYVMCLFVGIVAREIGLLEENIMVKANSLGLAMAALMAVIFSSLTKATPAVLAKLLWPLVGSLTLGLIGIIIASVIVGKLVGFSKEMAISIGVSALFGFPGTFIISNEVANAVGETEEEKKAILDEILPKMLVAGFITVTIASVILAGFMAKFI